MPLKSKKTVVSEHTASIILLNERQLVFDFVFYTQINFLFDNNLLNNALIYIIYIFMYICLIQMNTY